MIEADCEREKDEVAKEHEEASIAVAQLETELVKLRETHTAKSKVRISLKANRTLRYMTKYSRLAYAV